MDFTKITKLLVSLFILISFTSVAYSVFPQFDFQTTQFPPGPVDIQAVASSGTQVGLYVNENYIGKVDVIGNSKTVFLDNSIQNEIIPIGANLIFKNNNPARVYKLNISGYSYKVLNFAQTLTFNSYNEGDVLYKDNQEGISKKITVVDELANVTFPGAESYLQDGDNTLRFVVNYPLTTLDTTETFEYVVNYKKYSNTISLTNFSNVTNQREVTLQGTVSDASSPLYYIINYAGEITNLGALKSIPKTGNKFNITIQNLREGDNIIRLITTDAVNSNLFNGEKRVTLLSDRTPPTIEFSSGFRQFTNDARLELNITTDAVTLDYIFNGRNYTENVIDGSVLISLTLDKGQNDLTLIATDIAGNVYKEAHQIELDTTDPDIKKPLKDNLDPPELASGGTLHFFFQKINGKTNKPNVEMTIFTIPEGIKNDNNREVTCEDYTNNNVFYRKLGQLDREGEIGSEVNLNESQLSLLGLINNKKTITSDSEGSFDTIITLQEKSFTTSDLNTAQNAKTPPKVGSVNSRNTICMIMQDKFGNVGLYKKTISLDAGNTMWRPGEITTIPNTIYAAEIEQTGDRTLGTGNVEFGMLARFQYIGPGKVTNFGGFTISLDNMIDKNPNAKLETSRMNWMMDKDTNELTVYIPVKILPRNIKPLDYPDKLDFAFQLNNVNYILDDNTIPIDERNPIYFQTSINIERPLDHTKWLTPATIQTMQAFLNQSITATKKAVEYLSFATIGGVLTCQGAKMYYGSRIAFAKADGHLSATDRKDKIDEYTKGLYMVCDRVIGIPSPQECVGDFSLNNDNSGYKIDPNKKSYSKADLLDYPILNKDENKRSELTGLKLGDACDTDGDGTLDGISASGSENIKDTSNTLGPATIVENRFNNCAKANYGFVDKNNEWFSTKTECGSDCSSKAFGYVGDGNKFISTEDYEKLSSADKKKYKGTEPQRVDLKSASDACFSDKAPKFDQTKCNFFYADGEEGAPGWNPKDNIFESIRCGVITDTYSHTKNWLKYQEMVNKCLDQAKIGQVKGGYCERIISIGVCDMATNVLFKTLLQSPTTTPEGETTRSENFLFTAFSGSKEGDKLLNDRYSDTFYSQAGLATDQIVNKMCLVALTGDWSVLTENLLNAIDKNEVKPTFMPMFPTSRFQGYNPMTGKISVQYRLTYGTVAGPQINSKVEFICDSSLPDGNYCPPGRKTSSQLGGSTSIRDLPLYTEKGGSKQDLIVAVDGAARYRFNVACITHTYTLEGKTETTEPKCDHIFPQGDLFEGCYWDGGLFATGATQNTVINGQDTGLPGGITCNTIFSDSSTISLYNLNSNTKVVPAPANKKATLYSGNKVLLDTYLDVRPNAMGQMENLNMYYYFKCNQGDGGESPVAYEPVNLNNGNPQLISLLEIPELAIKNDNILATTSLPLNKGTKIWKIGAEYKSGVTPTTTPSFNIIGIDVDGKSMPVSSTTINLISNPYDIKSQQIIELNKDLIQSDSKKITLRLDKYVEGVNFWAEELQQGDYDILEFMCFDDNGDFDNGKCGDNNNFKQDISNPVKRINFGSVIKQADREQDQLENLNVGSCTLNAMLVPANMNGPQTRAEFNNFSIMGDNIDSNLQKSAIYQTEFTVGNPTADKTKSIFTFEIVRPFDSQSFCVGTKDIDTLNQKIDIIVPAVSSFKSYPYGESENQKLLSSKISFSTQTKYDVTTTPLQFNWESDLGYYKSTFDLKDYKLPTGKTGEAATIYVTYTNPEVANSKPVTLTKQISFNNCDKNLVDQTIDKVEEKSGTLGSKE